VNNLALTPYRAAAAAAAVQGFSSLIQQSRRDVIAAVFLQGQPKIAREC